MQTLTWYSRRLRAMSAGELAWRVRSALRDRVDRGRLAAGLIPKPLGDLRLYPESSMAARWCPLEIGAWRVLPAGDPRASWRDALIARADAIRAHRFSFFDLEQVDVGTPVDWNRDHASGTAAPRTFAAAIDYRDARVTGDAKVVWEPNRHHHLVVLARAYRATGRIEYASAVAEQLESWLDQSPFGFGMNWRSPLELAIRAINWVWAIDLLTGSNVFAPALSGRLLHALRLHVWEIARKYSRGSSANNHLIGEAAGVFVATSYCGQLPDAAALRRDAGAILAREIVAQTFPSGATREQAFGYHLFVLQFFVYAGFVARWSRFELPAEYWQRLGAMLEFADALCEAGPAPAFGDADDGYVLDLGNGVRDVRAIVAVGALLREQRGGDVGSSRVGVDRPPVETIEWLKAPGAADHLPAVPRSIDGAAALTSRDFPDTGYYLLQWGSAGDRDRVSVLFDCGELGFTAIAAHGHADALSFTLRAFGHDVFVDPGTFDYFTYPEWREYFRSTRAHNTVVVDGESQSVLLGSFLWGERATARCTAWEGRADGGAVAGEHDGYRRLADPVICRRRLELSRASRSLIVDDEIAAQGAHDVTLCFHLADGCEARQDGQVVRIDFSAGAAVLRLDGRLAIRMVKGGGPEEGGWVSAGYHRRAPAWTILASARVRGDTTIRSAIELDLPTWS
jgi:hypothetical protein